MSWKHEAMSLYIGLLDLGLAIEEGRVSVADLEMGMEGAAMMSGLEAADGQRARVAVAGEVVMAARAKLNVVLESMNRAAKKKCAAGREAVMSSTRTVNALGRATS